MELPIQVSFELTCVELPGTTLGECNALRLGIQQGNAVTQDVPADVAEVCFRFSAEVVRNRTSGAPQFKGPYIHGPASGQFVYFSWGERQSEQWHLIRRAKLALGEIGWELIFRVSDRNLPLRARIAMSNAKGEPRAASIPADEIAWS